MGACFISRSVLAVKDSINGREINSWSHSTDSYSGDWNTCDLVRERIKIFDKFTETNKKKFFSQKKYEKMIDAHTGKRESTVWDLGIHHYEVWSYKKVPITSKEKPVYKTCYVTSDYEEFPTQKAADEHARELILSGKYRTASVRKTTSLVKGNEIQAKYELVSRTYKSKPKSVKANAVCKEIHYYYVSAFAAE